MDRVSNGEVKIGENMLYAIVENGGKQYKAVEGSFIDLDLLPDEVGQKKILDRILLLVDGENLEVGSPLLPKVKVETTVVEHFKGSKIIVFKYRAKQRYRVKTGHRQKYTRVLVDSIIFSGKKESPTQANTEKAAEKEKTPAKKSRAKPSSAAKKPAVKTPTKAKAQATKKEPGTATKKQGPISVEKLDLGTRATAALTDAGIKTVAQLAKKLEAGESKLMEVPGIGAKTVEDIKKKLKKMSY